jgi:D-threo-aldose 1-dehydrogenase
MKRSVERSSRLLGLDRFELMYLHDPEHTTFEEAMAPGGPVEALRRYKNEGVIEYLGVAGGPIDMSIRYVETGLFDVAISHNRYTLLNTAAAEFWDVCERYGVGAVNAAPYGSGLLAAGPSAYPRYAYQPAREDTLNRARRLEEFCSRHNVPLAAAALQFSIRDRRISSTIVGIDRPDLLEETVRLAQYPIPNELWDELATVAPAKDDPEAERFKKRRM